MVNLSTANYLLIGLILSYMELNRCFVLQAPLKFDDHGNRKIKVGHEKYSLDSKNHLKIRIQDCKLSMDFTPANKTEISMKKGVRKVAISRGCKKILETSGILGNEKS
ncbi:unnamed protein product [Schistosoma guineensis]|nr:unnamed protein product [Schistosoma guineensis]